ncbi:hypothetical protein EVAR_57782_1 [Eumeta japonica]|uniref:Uncharacterized protein n=1 Tax=Eumeta variegata TaxID=151549 RepID=A0A4C1Y7Y1_EUMVA|nr:hypothetical protein EVAR_57782_1 [Eumeta japonica]
MRFTPYDLCADVGVLTRNVRVCQPRRGRGPGSTPEGRPAGSLPPVQPLPIAFEHANLNGIVTIDISSCSLAASAPALTQQKRARPALTEFFSTQVSNLVLLLGSSQARLHGGARPHPGVRCCCNDHFHDRDANIRGRKLNVSGISEFRTERTHIILSTFHVLHGLGRLPLGGFFAAQIKGPAARWDRLSITSADRNYSSRSARRFIDYVILIKKAYSWLRNAWQLRLRVERYEDGYRCDNSRRDDIPVVGVCGDGGGRHKWPVRLTTDCLRSMIVSRDRQLSIFTVFYCQKVNCTMISGDLGRGHVTSLIKGHVNDTVAALTGLLRTTFSRIPLDDCPSHALDLQTCSVSPPSQSSFPDGLTTAIPFNSIGTLSSYSHIFFHPRTVLARHYSHFCP